MNENGDMLKGWKAIADYFQSNERTVRRWQGLPVRKVGGSIYTTRSELDEWVKSGGRQAAALATPEEALPQAAPEPASSTPSWKVRVIAVFSLLLLALVLALTMNEATPQRIITPGRALALLPHARIAGTDHTPMGGFLSSFTGELFLFFRERTGFAVFDLRTLHKTYVSPDQFAVEIFTSLPGHRFAYFTHPDPPAVYRLDVKTREVSKFWSNGQMPFSLTLAPDGKFLFIGAKVKHIVRINTDTRDEVRFPLDGHPKAIEFTTIAGQDQLWIAHQGYGRIGSFGADAIETIDPWTGRFLRDSFLKPHVGASFVVLPRVQRIWLDGNDVCLGKQYHTAACPHSPGNILHVLSPDHSLLFTVGFPSKNGAFLFPSPDEAKVIMASDGLLRTLDSRSGQIIELADTKATQVLWAPDGSAIYLPTSDRKLLMAPVMSESCLAGLESAMHVWNADGHSQDSFAASHLTLRAGVTFVPGLIGQAFQFNGNTSADADASKMHRFLQLGGLFSFFLKRNKAKSSQSVADWLDSDGTRLRVSIEHSGVLAIEFAPAGGKQVIQRRSTAILSVGKWHHVALNLKGQGWQKPLILTLYLDAVPQGSIEIPIPPPTQPSLSQASLTFGKSGSAEGFTGSLDEITVHTHETSESVLRTFTQSWLAGTCAQQALRNLPAN
ncbi:MAG: hypothetical protein JST93_37390 [Acidobacteria bacterium]|nr:hypothetical protein [Acidobacteriota bacterium]